MTTKHTYLLIALSFFLLTFNSPSEPCVKVNKIKPSYLNSWSDTEEREYQDCNDTSKYYLRMYKKEALTFEGYVINNQKEGTWKIYSVGIPSYEELYFHNKLIKSKSFDGSWTNIIINDSLSYTTEYSKGKSHSSGLSIDRLKSGYWLNYGVWEVIDSIGQKSYGKYTPEMVFDTITMEDIEPPYLSYDSVFGSQRKDSIWFYFDSNNNLIKIEIYDKGELRK